MKLLIRRILREVTDPTWEDYAEKILTAVQDIGSRTPRLFKKGLVWAISNVVGHKPTHG